MTRHRRDDHDPFDPVLGPASGRDPGGGFAARFDGVEPERVRGPEEFLHAVPYLLGFHPSDSLVLVGLDLKIVAVTARLDLADAADPAVVDHTLRAIARGGADEVIAAVYADPVGPPSSALYGLVDVVTGIAERVGLDLCDALHVSGSRWWSYLCTSELCCPADGRPVQTSVSGFAAAATVAGKAVLPDRAALEAVFEVASPDDRLALLPAISAAEREAVSAVLEDRAATHERSLKRALFARARASDEPGWTGLDDTEVARFGAGLAQIVLRDATWVAIEQRRVDGRPLWLDLARRLPEPYDAAPAFLYGWASWRAGDGARAGIAAERALRSDPLYSAADLLLAALSSGVDPRRMPRLRLPRSPRPAKGSSGSGLARSA